MMTTEAELRAAAERVMDHAEEILEFHGDGNTELESMAKWRDQAAVARAWLADHPADSDIAVTAEWLESVGIVRGCFADRCYGWHHGARCFTITVKTPRGYASNIDIHTRGQVRAILAALS